MPDPDPWLELLDAGRVSDAGASRSRQRWLAAAAAADVTVAGALLDLAERGDRVVVGVVGGGARTATVRAVGVDVVVLAGDAGVLHLVPLRSVSSLRALEGRLPHGERPVPYGPSLVELLARIGEREDPVVVRLTDGTTVAGIVDLVGADVIRVAPEEAGPGPTYVSVTSIGEAAVFRSG
jgi:hypothetical protein